MSEPDYKQILLSLIGSLTIAEHIGDVSNSVCTALKKIGMEPPSEVDWEDLGDWLGRTHGVTTLYGTSLIDED